jgi:4-amino-4-deoxy-L-arabinose transferase-like glycosyltransferase
MIAIYLLGSLLFSKRAGFFSAFVFGISVEYVILSRACITDMALSTFMLLGALFFFYGYVRNKGYYYFISSAAFALATLTKGPIFAVLVIGILFVFLLAARDLKALKRMPVALVALVFLAVSLPWYVIAYKMHGMAFIDQFFGFHNILRFTQSEHKIGSQFYYNIPIVLGGMFPWSVFLPAALWNAFKKFSSGDEAKKKYVIFFLVWFFAIFAFFTASSTKLPTYIFPSFFALAILVGVLWDDFLGQRGFKGIAKWMNASYWSFVVITVAGIIGGIVYAKIDYPAITGGVALSCAFLLLGTILSACAFRTKRYVAAFFLIVYALGISLYPMKKLVLPIIEHYETSKTIAAELIKHMKPEERIGSESNYLAGLAFYTGKYPTDLDKHHELVKFVESPERVWGVLKEKNHRELYELATEPFCLKASYMVYKIGKRAIITNQLPEDGKYITRRERLE